MTFVRQKLDQALDRVDTRLFVQIVDISFKTDEKVQIWERCEFPYFFRLFVRFNYY